MSVMEEKARETRTNHSNKATKWFSGRKRERHKENTEYLREKLMPSPLSRGMWLKTTGEALQLGRL